MSTAIYAAVSSSLSHLTLASLFPSPLSLSLTSPSLVSLYRLPLSSLSSLSRLSLVSLSLHHHIVKVDYVQSRADLMPGFFLKLTIKNSECDAGESCVLV